jgi:uncharacterized membrane protein
VLECFANPLHPSPDPASGQTDFRHLRRNFGRGEGDFSRNLPTITHDELRTLAESYNRFADKMREIISEVRKMSVNIAREAVQVKRVVSETAVTAGQQGEMPVLFLAPVPRLYGRFPKSLLRLR